jgi:hypothetical protein
MLKSKLGFFQCGVVGSRVANDSILSTTAVQLPRVLSESPVPYLEEKGFHCFYDQTGSFSNDDSYGAHPAMCNCKGEQIQLYSRTEPFAPWDSVKRCFYMSVFLVREKNLRCQDRINISLKLASSMEESALVPSNLLTISTPRSSSIR